MASWLDTFKTELNTNTMKNPLDTILPKIGIHRPGGAKPPTIKPSPLKAKAKETTNVIGDDFKKVETTVKSWLLPIIIILIIFNIGKK